MKFVMQVTAIQNELTVLKVMINVVFWYREEETF
jgi:hypothetical protein